MKLWKRRKPRSETPPPPATNNAPQRSPETRRAIEAARDAAHDLAAARRLRAKVDRTAEDVSAENSKNGFRLLIEDALGGKA